MPISFHCSFSLCFKTGYLKIYFFEAFISEGNAIFLIFNFYPLHVFEQPFYFE